MNYMYWLKKSNIDLICGTLLGDSFMSIDKRHQGKSYRLIFQHTNKKYFKAKVSLLKLQGTISNVTTGYGSKAYKFTSMALTKNKFSYKNILLYRTS